MKNIILLVTFVVAMTFVGCEDDLLEKYPKTTLNPDTFWNNKEDVLAAVNGLYPNLPGWNWINNDQWSDIAVSVWPAGNGKIEGGASSGSGVALGGYSNATPLWKNLYKSITAANYFLENVDDVQDLDASFVLRVKAEARFIRAFNYMELAMDFGDVPLITKTISQQEGFEVVRNPVANVWDFIENELTAISYDLPIQYSGSDIGRITQGAVFALKAKTMLYAGRYQKAYNAAKTVIGMGYTLYPDYSELFDYDAQNNSEVILDSQYEQNLRSYNHFFQNAPNEMSITTTCVYNVTADFVDAFQMKTTGLDIDDASSGWDMMNPYLDRDPRLSTSIFIPYFSESTDAFEFWNTGNKLSPQPGSGTTDEVHVTHTRNRTGFFINKYINEDDLVDNKNCGTNFILLRYADVLLIASEALIELNLDLSEAKGYIDQVRLRAEMPALAVSLSSQSDLRQAVRQERMVELGLEGWRFYDINRWRIAENVISGSALGMSYLDENDEIQIVNSSVARTFDPAKDYLLPIPFDEIILNPNLTQNPGY